MNLKEAFTYSNRLENLKCQFEKLLISSSYAYKTVRNHDIASVRPERTNFVEEVNNVKQYDVSENEIICAIEYLIKERETLTNAIFISKKNMDVDLDGLISMNKFIRSSINMFSEVCKFKSSEVNRNGSDYTFNNEGNQVPFYYPVKEITTIDFDRNVVKAIVKRLTRECDDNSTKVDELMINTKVDFEAKFDEATGVEDVIDVLRN